MPAFAQTSRLLTFTSPLGANALLPERLTGVEGVSELFVYQLELLAETQTAIDPKKIVGQKVCVGIQADDSGTQRYLNGVVSSFELSGGDDEFLTYRATIVPNLWTLTLNKNTRVFQNQTVIDVIKAVLSPYNISPAIDTSDTYTPLEYCTQYRETDFAFISRLMEQHGILYYFKHTRDDHTFTLQDVSSKLSDCAVQSSFRYAPQQADSEGFYDFVVRDFSSRSSLVSGKYTAWDYSFIQYKAVPAGGATADSKGPLGSNGNEQYDYADSAAAYLKKVSSDSKIGDLTTFFNNVRRDSGDAESVIVGGASNAISMQTGYTFTLNKHPQDSLNVKYLLLHIELTLQQLPSYRTRSASSADPYENRFIAIPSSIPYRAPIKTEKPVVNGMHTGQVVVPSGEDLYIDKYGRVNVQFWWDRLRKPNTPDNTLLRVAQSWAGKGWGTYYWPRAGDEVLIGFMEGDPDQPIVVGSVYNGVNMPKYALPDNSTRSGLVTRSSKGGGAANANELRFEDKTGSEQIFLNAEMDMDHRTEKDHRRFVGGKDSLIVTANQLEQIGGEHHREVKSNSIEKIDGNADLGISGNQTEQVGGNQSLNVGSNQSIQVGTAYSLNAGQTVYINGGMNVVIQAGMQLSLVGPGGFVTIGPEGVSISGTMVMINSGGAAGSGSPGQTPSPKTPTAPDKADDGTKGGKM
jgi:type VI secretion system secreted protein VgrG